MQARRKTKQDRLFLGLNDNDVVKQAMTQHGRVVYAVLYLQIPRASPDIQVRSLVDTLLKKNEAYVLLISNVPCSWADEMAATPRGVFLKTVRWNVESDFVNGTRTLSVHIQQVLHTWGRESDGIFRLYVTGQSAVRGARPITSSTPFPLDAPFLENAPSYPDVPFDLNEHLFYNTLAVFVGTMEVTKFMFLSASVTQGKLMYLWSDVEDAYKNDSGHIAQTLAKNLFEATLLQDSYRTGPVRCLSRSYSVTSDSTSAHTVDLHTPSVIDTPQHGRSFSAEVLPRHPALGPPPPVPPRTHLRAPPPPPPDDTLLFKELDTLVEQLKETSYSGADVADTSPSDPPHRPAREPRRRSRTLNNNDDDDDDRNSGISFSHNAVSSEWNNTASSSNVPTERVHRDSAPSLDFQPSANTLFPTQDRCPHIVYLFDSLAGRLPDAHMVEGLAYRDPYEPYVTHQPMVYSYFRSQIHTRFLMERLNRYTERAGIYTFIYCLPEEYTRRSSAYIYYQNHLNDLQIQQPWRQRISRLLPFTTPSSVSSRGMPRRSVKDPIEPTLAVNQELADCVWVAEMIHAGRCVYTFRHRYGDDPLSLSIRSARVRAYFYNQWSALCADYFTFTLDYGVDYSDIISQQQQRHRHNYVHVRI